MADKTSVVENSKKNECKQCLQSFANKTQLAKHMFLHREGFICPYCNKPFASESGLKRHWNANHKNAKPIPHCDICGEKFGSRRDLEKHHLMSHRADKHFKCKFCGAKFSWITNLKKHESFHTNGPKVSTTDNLKEKEEKAEPPSIFQCHICKKTFNYDFTYAIHIAGHNSAIPPAPQNNASSTTHSNSTTTSVPVELIIEVVPSDDPDKSQAIVSIETVPEHQQISQCSDPKNEQSGSVVEKVLSSEENKDLFEVLKGHKQRRDEQMRKKLKKKPENAIYDCVMTEEKPFKCKICAETFRWEISLEIHEQLHIQGKTLKIRKPYVKHKKISNSNTKLNESATTSKPGYDKNKYKIVYQKESDDDNDDDEDASYSEEDDELSQSVLSDEMKGDDGVSDDQNSKSHRMKKHIKDNSHNDPKIRDGETAMDNDSNKAVDHAKKFTKKLSTLLMGTKNSTEQIDVPNDVVGQLVLVNSVDDNMSLEGSKVLSADGSQYIINNGFLCPLLSNTSSSLQNKEFDHENDESYMDIEDEESQKTYTDLETKVCNQLEVTCNGDDNGFSNSAETIADCNSKVIFQELNKQSSPVKIVTFK